MSSPLPASAVRLVSPLNEKPECLKEGLAWIVIDLDFSTIPVLPLDGSFPYVDLPEMTIGRDSGDGPGGSNSVTGYQVIEFTLGQLNNGNSISQCVSLMFHFRPQWWSLYYSAPVQPPADFVQTSNQISAFFVTSQRIGQTVSIPSNGNTENPGDVCWIVDGCVPFYASPNDTIRIIRLCELQGSALTTQLGAGRATLIFSNYQIPPFLNLTIPTLDNP